MRDATLDTTAALVAEHGLASVTMSRIAEKTGIGRATLYKYFPDVEAILSAWHERQIARHLAQLAEVRDKAGDAGKRLETVLQAYAHIHHQRVQHHRNEPHGAELAALLHPDEHVTRALQHMRDMFRDLLIEAVETGDIRDDVTPDELATYACTPSLRQAICHPNPRSNASSRSLSLECAHLSNFTLR